MMNSSTSIQTPKTPPPQPGKSLASPAEANVASPVSVPPGASGSKRNQRRRKKKGNSGANVTNVNVAPPPAPAPSPVPMPALAEDANLKDEDPEPDSPKGSVIFIRWKPGPEVSSNASGTDFGSFVITDKSYTVDSSLAQDDDEGKSQTSAKKKTNRNKKAKAKAKAKAKVEANSDPNHERISDSVKDNPDSASTKDGLQEPVQNPLSGLHQGGTQFPVPNHHSRTASNPSGCMSTSQTAPCDNTVNPPITAVPTNRSEYQHFIPRFVIRDFATAEERSLERRNPFVKVYTLADSEVKTPRVARCYGNINMYHDVSAEDEMHIERALAMLEREAGNVISRIKDAQMKDQAEIQITRGERDAVRKFLFVMKYRAPLFRTKYDRSVEEYKYEDFDDLILFMRENNFSKPIEVWLHTLKTILDTHIDPKREWETVIQQKCFVHDAKWFISNINDSFMAFCQPAHPDDEFILSDTAFGIHEGPTEATYSANWDPDTQLIYSVPTGAPNAPSTSQESQIGYGAYTEYHKLAPFSPKLLLVLRSNSLRMAPGMLNDMYINASQIAPNPGFLRKMMESLASSQPLRPSSLFDHLPLYPPAPSYGIAICVGTTGTPFTDDDSFAFPLHKIHPSDVLLFNSIILNEVRQNLTWQSDEVMKKTLREYLEKDQFRIPVPVALSSSREEVFRMELVKRRENLRCLLAILEKRVRPATHVPLLHDHLQRLSVSGEDLLHHPLFKGYFKLGGTLQRWIHDLQQGFRIGTMRTNCADAMPPGPHLVYHRNGIFRNELQLWYTLPPRIVYIHIVDWRLRQKARMHPELPIHEVVKAEYLRWRSEILPEEEVANMYGIIPEQHLSKLLLQVSFREVTLEEHRGKGLSPRQAELFCYGFFGGILSSFLVEPFSCHDPQIDLKILDTYYEQPIPNKLFENELLARARIKELGILEHKWGKTVDDFVWKWLYGV